METLKGFGMLKQVIKIQHNLCRLFIVVALSLAIGCHTQHPIIPTAGDQIISTMQNSIEIDKGKSGHYNAFAQQKTRFNNAFLPPLSHYVNPAKEAEPRFDVNANKVPAKEFYMGLIAGTKYNIVIHPNITGTVSLILKNVTLKQALDAVEDMYGYEYHQTSYGYEILPAQLETQLFHINYLDVQRTGRSYTQLTTGQVSNKVGTVTVGGATSTSTNFPTTQGVPEGVGTISSIETKSEMQFWKDLQKAIENVIGKEEGRSVTVNAQAGVIIVRAYPGELHRVARYVNSLQSSLNRQVILEAKILEIQLDDTFQSGIDWSILGNPALAIVNSTGDTTAGIGQAGNVAFENTDLKALSGIFAWRINGNFQLLLQLLQSQGNVQVLSSPHISTVNNQKAVIKVGQDEFFVTGVSTSNTIIGSNTLPSQDVSLTPFFSGITLDVTPEISGDDSVILHVHPSVSRVTEQTKVIGLGATASGAPNNLTLPLAFSTIRESDNIVRARNGQIIVIGGLMQNRMAETVVGTPWLSKIPFIGILFRRTSQISIKSELVILLRPMVVTNKTLVNTLENEKKTFEILKRPFHAGGLPKVFGNEAETSDKL